MAYSNGLGVSFQPGVTDGQQRTPVQKAVQLLSLRLPTVIGAQGIAPQALLQSQGGQGFSGGMPTDAALELLRRLLGTAGHGGLGNGFAMPTQAGGFGGITPTMGLPTPRIIPQDTPDTSGTATKDAGLPPNMDNRGPDTFSGSLDREKALQYR